MAKVEKIAIDDLAPDPANLREHGDRNRTAIRSSLKRFGAGHDDEVATEPVIVLRKPDRD